MLILFNKKSTGNGPCELAKTKFTPNPFLSKQSDSDSSNFSLGKTLNLNYKIETSRKPPRTNPNNWKFVDGEWK